MKLGRLNHIGVASGKPLPFRGGVGVGASNRAQCLLLAPPPPPPPPREGRQ
jgi:hypothetical protein